MKKMRQLAFSFVFFLFSSILAQNSTKISDESQASHWVANYESKAVGVYGKSVQAGWNYFTNVSLDNRHNLMETEFNLSNFMSKSAEDAEKFDWRKFQNGTLKRLFMKITDRGLAALNEQSFRRYTELESEIADLFETTLICENGRPPPCTLSLNGDITRIFATSRDFETLYYLWEAWRDAVGPAVRPKYMELAQLGNEAAELNGYEDLGAMWRADYERSDVRERFERLYQQIKPLYEQLHAYVRGKLNAQYAGYLYRDKTLPAHLLGDFWGASMLNLYQFVAPAPDQLLENPTVSMFQQNYTVTRMFKDAENYFVSMGLPRLPDKFWQESLLVQPLDRPVVCVPAAVDFRNGDDFRLKMCSKVTADDYVAVHSQLAHAYYYMLAGHDQPFTFRDAADPAMQDAVGGLMNLLIGSPYHFQKLGLLELPVDSRGTDLNYLIRHALDRLVLIPFALVADLWRWEFYAFKIPETNYTQRWWDLREQYQGISPPARRPATMFDPGASWHIAQNVPYSRYFISTIMQFQLLGSLCKQAGHTGPLYTCSLDGKKGAGEKLKAMMALGSSKPWYEALAEATGTPDLDAVPMLEYFQPLFEWLQQENMRTGEYLGWMGPGVPYGSEQPTVAPNDVIGQVKSELNANFGADIGTRCRTSAECGAGSACMQGTCACRDGFREWMSKCVPNTNLGNGLAVEVQKLDETDVHQPGRRPPAISASPQPPAAAAPTVRTIQRVSAGSSSGSTSSLLQAGVKKDNLFIILFISLFAFFAL